MWSIVRVPFTVLASIWAGTLIAGLIIGIAMASGHC